MTMKNLISIITLTLIFSCCSKKDVQITTSTQLPQATQTGANTAGCLVNGQVFLPKGSSQAGPILSCFYQQDQDGYHMGLNIADKSNSSIKAVNISLNPAQLLDNVTYSLSEITNGTLNYASNFGEFIIYSNINSDNRFNTNLLNQRNILMKHIFFICFTALLFTSCQKDLLIDTGAVIPPTTIAANCSAINARQTGRSD